MCTHCKYHVNLLVRKKYLHKLYANTHPSMGVQNGGNMFPGVTLPFGVVKIGVDMLPATGTADAYSGYLPSGRVTGFSLMHESGTGGAPKYGVVSQLPLTGAVENPLVDNAPLRVGDDEAEVGRYKTTLANGVVTELTAAAHAGMMRHRFAGADGGVHVLVDVSHFLPSFRGQGIEQKYVEGEIEVDAKGKYTGFGVYKGGWNLGISFSPAPAPASFVLGVLFTDIFIMNR